MQNQSIFREHFFVIVVAALFVTVGGLYIYLGFPNELRDYTRDLFIALLTLIGLRPRANTTNVAQADNVSADNVERASTLTGDINAGAIKETVQNES